MNKPHTFKYREDAYAQLQRSTRGPTILLLAITAVGSMITMWLLNPDKPEMLVIMPFLFLGLLIYMRLRPSPQALAMKAAFASYRLTIDDTCIRRESDGLPTIEIAHRDVASIERQTTKAWLIKSKTSADMIGIQPYMEVPEQLEALLQTICPITYSAKATNWKAYSPAIAAVMIALMIGIFAVKTPWVVIACGSIATVLLLGSTWFSQRSKYIPEAAKKKAWFIILPITAIVVRVAMAIMGQL